MRGLTIALSVGLLSSAAWAQQPNDPTEDGGELSADLRKPFPVTTTLSSQFRMLAVVDEDPKNDQILLYGIKAAGPVFDGGTVFLGVGASQRFEAEPDESAFDLRDSQLGLTVKTPVALGDDLELGIANQISFFLPTSRASRNQDLYVAPQALVRFSVKPIKALTLSVVPRFRYRIHEFAERAGTAGAMNVQLDTGVRGGVGYQIAKFKLGGKETTIGAGVSAGTTYLKKYASRDAHTSDFADSSVWLQQYDWEGHVGFGWWIFEAGVAVEQGGGVLRNGVVNTFLAHRDETQLAFSLAASL